MNQPTPQPAGEPGGNGTSLGIEPGLAALLACLFGWLSGLIVPLVGKEHREARFHAAQSLLVSGAIGPWIHLMVKGYKLEHVELWIVGDHAEQLTTRI